MSVESSVRFKATQSGWPGPIPVASIDSEAYWAGVRERELHILCCQDCAYWAHYPLARSCACYSAKLAAEAISGHLILNSFTVSHREFVAAITLPTSPHSPSWYFFGAMDDGQCGDRQMPRTSVAFAALAAGRWALPSSGHADSHDRASATRLDDEPTAYKQ